MTALALPGTPYSHLMRNRHNQRISCDTDEAYSLEQPAEGHCGTVSRTLYVPHQERHGG